MKGIIDFLESAYSELKKVTWPNRETVLKLTAVVIGISVFVAIFLGVLDVFLNEGLQSLIT